MTKAHCATMIEVAAMPSKTIKEHVAAQLAALDAAAHAEGKSAVTVVPVGEFELKGIRRPMAAYNVVACAGKQSNRPIGNLRLRCLRDLLYS